MKETGVLSEERLHKAIHHQQVDRISCAPLIEGYAARFYGLSTYEFLFNEKKAMEAFRSIKERYDVWDIRRSLYFMHHGPYQPVIGLMKALLPKEEDETCSEIQFLEDESLSREDYRVILDQGYEAYLLLVYKRLYGAAPSQVEIAREQLLDIQKKEIEASEECGQLFLYGDHLYMPASYFSNLRSFQEFVRDVYQIPEILKEVFRIAMDHCLDTSIKNVERSGIRRVMIGAPRISQGVFSRKIFENLFWPELERCATVLIQHDITPVFHLDGNWDRDMEYFRTLPKHKSIIELDGGTDLYAAKKILDNHTCLLGDVPAQLFTLGSPKEVKEYCSRLLREFGPAGGFILGSGCTVPYDSRHKNVEAFFQSIEEFGGD